MFSFLKNLFGKYDFDLLISEINSREPEIVKLSSEELKKNSFELKEKIRNENNIDKFLPEAFTFVREASKRVLNQRHFDVQLIGGIALHQGKIAEMKTGEGKTLAATAPAYLNALTGRGVHIITVNDYLARRDTVWMGQIYNLLGMTVGCLTHNTAYFYDPTYTARDNGQMSRDGEQETENNQDKLDKERDILGSFKVFQEYLRPISRKEAYKLDILYGTNHEFGFDYLRDNLSYRTDDQVQRGHYFAIIDEVDSILIDEARTPLIIAAPDAESSEYYKIFSKAVEYLKKEEDYLVDEKTKSATITDDGITKIEKFLNIKNLYGPENFRLVHFLEESLRARALFHRDKHYVNRNGEIIIVDEFTGRLMPGRRYSGGLHQAIEAKEGTQIQQESKTYAQVTIQNYFRLYKKIAGMTGTAQTSAEEFHKVYKLEVITIPTNKPSAREDLPDLIYKNKKSRYNAAVAEIKRRCEMGQPVLVGTASINNNEIISGLLNKAGVKHEVLNAKNHEREGEIIAQAGKPGAVTVATNMAGRGVDIILGGNPPSPMKARKVRDLGGLYVIGTERHEARRIDNQLQGRAGRQGDPGATQFFLSLEDDLMRIFGGEKIKSIMESFNLPEDQPIESKMVSRVVVEAQKKVEGINFDSRKHLLDYDDILNKQRVAVYDKRQKILENNLSESLEEIILNSFDRISAQNAEPENLENLEKTLINSGVLEKDEMTSEKDLKEILKEKIRKAITPENELETRVRVLATLDSLWMNHLDNLEALRESVNIRAYGQHDPLVEYRRESFIMFKSLFVNFEDWIFFNIWKLLSQTNTGRIQNNAEIIPRNSAFVQRKSVGRNEPCPCGSGKKYKKCHG
ncbi:MAG: preprotein translocase subunit SecA [Patescibacteria group bacterium]|nr:preprotein translocase subunit SecA [Patescibacteria group bacterium]